ADRFGKSDVRGNALSKKCMSITAARPVIKLRRQQNITRRIFFLQATYCRHRDEPAHVERAEGVDVGPVIDFVRQNSVTACVPRQKIDLATADLSANKHVRR